MLKKISDVHYNKWSKALKNTENKRKVLSITADTETNFDLSYNDILKVDALECN